MIKTTWFSVLTSLVLAGTARVQVPPAPVRPVAPVGPVAAPTKNIWSMFLMSPEQKAACKTHFCNSAIGKLANGATAPLSAMTGGLIQNRCLANSIKNVLDDKTKPPDSAEGAAARIKKNEAEAQARREAIRYLGTVDCNYWPEAEGALINGLSDPSECVRYEAALALTKGCCCTPNVIKALTHSVAATGKPPESSARVRAAAADALAQCVVEEPVGPVTPPVVPEIKKVEIEPRQLDPGIQDPRTQLVENARRALAHYRGEDGPVAAAPEAPRRVGSVAAILSGAISPTKTSVHPVSREKPAAADLAAAPESPAVPDSPGVPATLTSRSGSAEPSVAAPMAAPKAVAPVVSQPVERKPFFDNLTRALKGKQVARPRVTPSALPSDSLPAAPVPAAADTAPTTTNPSALPGEVEPTPTESSNPMTPRALPIGEQPAAPAQSQPGDLPGLPTPVLPPLPPLPTPQAP